MVSPLYTDPSSPDNSNNNGFDNNIDDDTDTYRMLTAVWEYLRTDMAKAAGGATGSYSGTNPSAAELRSWIGALDRLVSRMNGADPPSIVRKWLIAVVWNVVDDQTKSRSSWDPAEHRQAILVCLDMLKQLCQRVHALPESFRITPGSVTLHDSNRRPEATGGSADIWKASYMGRTVALKVIRDYEDVGPDRTGDLYCEAVIWKHLRHPNITPFYGIDTGSFALSFVSKWMPHGTITSYLKHNATAQRLGFISDVSEGLKYLHDIGIVHGDIKGSNILVNEKLVACLCDFGLAALSYEEKLPTRSVVKGSVRYMAPEIMDPEEFGLGRAILTPQSDVYSLGMTVWEMFAGCPPFHELRRDPVVIRRVVQGLRPERPEAADALGLTDRLWELLERCWHVKWDHRPDMDAILEYVTGQPKVAFLRPSRSPAGPRPSGTPPSHDPARPLPYATLIASSISSLRPHPDSHAAPIDALRSRTNLSSRRDTSRPSDDGELPTSVTTDIFHPLDVHQQPLPGYPEDITRKHGPKDPVTPELHIRLNEIPDKVSADDLISTGRLVVQAKFPAEKPLHRPKLSPLQFPKSLYATPAPPSSTRSSTRGPATSEQLPGPSPSPSSSSGHKAVRNWIRGEHIGRGTTGSDVYLALNAVTGEMMAIRQVRILDDCDESSQNNSAIRALRWEHDVLKDLDHQNLVQGLGYTEKAGVCTLFLEYVAGGSLQTCIDKYGRINEEVTKSFAREILSALEYLHSKGIIHTHLKSSNILLEPYGRCKVSDFGNCIRDNGTSADRRLSSAPGSIFWMAPEARNSSDWRSPMDIWSFGCIVLEMWTGRKPWGGVDASSVPMTDPLASEEVTLSPLAEDFRQSCFAKDPSHRATAAQLRQHGYLEAQPDWTFTGFK